MITTMAIQQRQRSPSVPFIGLSKATVRARQIYDRVGCDPLTSSDAARIWGISRKSSGLIRTIAALRGYGLADSPDDYRIGISDIAARLFRRVQQEAGEQQEAFVEAVLSHQLIADYAVRWRAGRPRDDVCIAELRTRHGFTPSAAMAFLEIFDEAMWFLGGGSTGIFTAFPESAEDVPSSSSGLKLGHYVQMPSDRAGRAAALRRVVWLADGGQYFYVQWDQTRYPVSAVRMSDGSPRSWVLRINASLPPNRVKVRNVSRSSRPAFPGVDLPRALDYTYKLAQAGGREWVPIAEAANAWYGNPDTRGASRIVAGLYAFGFTEKSGRGNKLRVSELGWRVLENPASQTAVDALREAVSRFPLIVDYARKWKDSRPPLPVCTDQVKREQGFSGKRAALFMYVFEHCAPFVETDDPEVPADTESRLPSSPVNAASNPDAPVDLNLGTPTDVPPLMSEPLEIAQNGHSGVDVVTSVKSDVPTVKESQSASSTITAHSLLPRATNSPSPQSNLLEIAQHGNRLAITADLDLAGVRQLQEMLPHYQRMLERSVAG